MRIDGNKREFFEKLMQDAKTHPDYERQMTLNKRNIEQYNGSRKIDPVDDSSELPDDAIVVRNITRELIESQKDMRIPAPKVTPRISLQHTDRNAKATERLLNMLRDKLPFERLNNTDEFYAPTPSARPFIWWSSTTASERTSRSARARCRSSTRPTSSRSRVFTMSTKWNTSSSAPV